MLSPDAIQDEINAHNARVYKKLYHNRGRHLIFLYTILVGLMIGGVLEHFWRL